MPLIAQFCYYGNTVRCYYFFQPLHFPSSACPPCLQTGVQYKSGFFSFSKIILLDHLNISPDMTNRRKKSYTDFGRSGYCLVCYLCDLRGVNET